MMKHLFSTLCLLFTLLLPATTTTFQIDQDRSKITFKIRHLLFTHVNGSFQKFDGNFTITKNHLQNLTGNVVVASISTRNDKRDSYLKSADFLDIHTYPTMTMRFLYLQNNQVIVALKIKNVTRNVALHYKITGDSENPRLHIHSKISRKDFDLIWSKAMESGGIVVGDNVEIDIKLQGKTP